MKHFVFFIVNLLVILFPLQGQTQSVRVKITPTAYIKKNVDRTMEEWMPKHIYESKREYKIRTLEVNKTIVRKQLEAEASAKFKALFTEYVNWSDLYIVHYNNAEQAFLIL